MRASQIIIIILLVAILAVGGLLIHRPTGGGNLVVYAPCGLSGPIQNFVQVFRAKHPEVPVSIVYDNANVLVRRVLKQGERPDVFISPGELELRQIAEANLVDKSAVIDFGTLDMVLIVPAKDHTVNKLEDLAAAKVTHVALGDPKFNSIGMYGQQILKARKLWDAVEPKLILKEYPLEAFNLVAEGSAQAGLAYLSCPLDTNPEKASKADVRIVEKIPRNVYGPIRVQAAALKGTSRGRMAKVFLDFLTSDDAQKVMAKDGLLPRKELKQ